MSFFENVMVFPGLSEVQQLKYNVINVFVDVLDRRLKGGHYCMPAWGYCGTILLSIAVITGCPLNCEELANQ